MPGFPRPPPPPPPPNFFIEYFSLQTSAKIIHRVCHILKKTKKDHKELRFAARLVQAIVIKAETSQNSFVGFVLFFFTIPWLVCFFFTLLPVIKLIKDHWHGSRPYKCHN